MEAAAVRTVFHVDMNAFFAAVEQAAHPGLRGKPIAVAGASSRTVIVTSSYEARAFGVKTGMRVPEAKALCPGLILVPADNAKYTDTCARLVELYRAFTDRVEVFSIDEVFLDVTDVLHLWPCAADLARAIKARIRREFRLTCSVGIAPNKLLAKLAGELRKPDGLVEISGDSPALFVLENLPVDTLCGIGPRLKLHLACMGIRTLGDLARCPRRTLEERFGLVGLELHAMARGLDETPVVPSGQEEEAKSVGHSMTLDRDVDDVREMKRHLLQLSEQVARRMRREGCAGRTVHVTVRTFDFETFGRQRSLGRRVDTGPEIHAVACGILEEFILARPVRLLGVSVSNLVHHSHQPSLFERDRLEREIVRAMDRVNDRWGEFTVTYAALLERPAHPRVIAPSWRPSGSRRVGF
jgi:DNA polymerase-4